MKGFVGRNGKIYSAEQRCAMFSRQRMNMTDEQEERLSDKIASVLGEPTKDFIEYKNIPVIINRPEMKIITGSTSGGKVAHLHFRRSEPINEGLVYVMNNKGVAEAKFSYDIQE
jgi:hypothetical protein